MKKALLILLLGSILLTPVLSFAQIYEEEELPELELDLEALFATIGTYLFSILMALAVIILVIAGYLFVTAGGSPEQLGKAKRMIVWALVGIAVALLARGLVTLVTEIFE